MRTLAATLATAGLTWLAAPDGRSQGTVYFSNRVPGIVDAPVVAPSWGGHFRTPIDDRFVAQLWAAPPGAELRPVGDPVPFAKAGLGQDGYFDGGVRVVPGVAPGDPIQVKVAYWYGNLGATYAEAIQKYQGGWGETGVIGLARSGGGAEPPAPLTGLGTASVSVTLGFDPTPRAIHTSGLPFPADSAWVTRTFEFFPTIEWVMGLAMSGDIACVAAGYGGLVTFDLSDPSRPVRVAELPLDHALARAIVLRGPRAYLALANWSGEPPFKGLRVVDVSRPSRPVAGAALALEGEPQSLALSDDGRLLLVAAGKTGMIVVDTQDPDAPRVAGRYLTDWPTVAVAISGNRALVGAGESGLHCVDVSDPTQPRRLGVYDAGEPVVAVTVRDALAIVGGRDAGLHMVDISDPTQPRRIGHLAVNGCTGGLLLDGDVLYLGESYDLGLKAATLTVVDVSDPSTPKRASRATLSMHGVGFATRRGRLWVADWVGLTAFPLGPVLRVEEDLSVNFFGTEGQRYDVQEWLPTAVAPAWRSVSEVVGTLAPRNIGRLPGPDGTSRLLRAVPKR